MKDSDDLLYCSNCHEPPETNDRTKSKAPSPDSSAHSAGVIDSTIGSKSLANALQVTTQSMGVRVRRSGAFAKMYQDARKEWNVLLCSGMVCKVSHTRRRRKDEDIREALLFIFNPQNVQLLSWGSKSVKVDGKWTTLPAVMRRKTMEHMFRDYKIFIENKESRGEIISKPLGRSAFLEICDSVTRGMQKRKAAVDYVLGALAYDNLRVALNVVKGELYASDRYELYLKQIDAIEEFIKFSYLEHIGSSHDAVHDQNFSLSEVQFQETVPLKRADCSTCMTPLQVVENIKNDISAARQDVKDVLKDVQEKLLLYYGHQHRCYNQEKRISELFGELRSDTATSNAIVLMDYKMKFEPIRYREKTTEFFREKRI